MKKAFLIAFLALSITVYAQSKYPKTNLKENGQNLIDPTLRTLSKVHSEILLGQAFESKKPEQPSLYQEYDSIYSWVWDTIVGWKSGSREINMFYDATHNLTNSIEQGWNGSTWVNFWQENKTYDAHNNLTNFVEKKWNVSNWENYAMNDYTYDTNNLVTSEMQSNWYDTAWQTHGQYRYAYDISNNNLISSIRQLWNDSIWVDEWLKTYSYDVHNNQTSFLWQGWNGSIWFNYQLYTSSFDSSNNNISTVLQEWNDSVWVNWIQFLSTYDTNNNLTSSTWQFWNSNSNTWRNSQQYIYTYDANNFKLSDLTYSWNIDGTVYKKYDSTHYYFHTNVGINEQISSEESITVYPNPNGGKFVIRCNSPIRAIEIYNLFGERIYSDYKFNQLISIDLSNQAKGIYLTEIYIGTKICCRKIVVQ